MSEKIRGYTEAASIESNRMEDYEEADSIVGTLPDNFRVVERSGKAEYLIERETDYAGFWVRVAVFTEPDAKYEWAEEIDKETGDEYRCVVDRTNGEVVLEAWYDE